MTESQPITGDLRVRESALLRFIWTAVAAMLPFGVIWYASASGASVLSGVLASVLLELIAASFAILAYRSEFRADQHEILCRGYMTRRMSPEDVEQIRFAIETERGGFWPFQRTKIEIRGKGVRLLYSGPSKRVEPVLVYLQARFPHLVEETGSLPDA